MYNTHGSVATGDSWGRCSPEQTRLVAWTLVLERGPITAIIFSCAALKTEKNDTSSPWVSRN